MTHSSQKATEMTQEVNDVKKNRHGEKGGLWEREMNEKGTAVRSGQR